METHGRLASVQVLRGLAAMLVVFHHAGHAMGSGNPIVEAGGVGVDIFFVISGFIMIHVAQPYLDRTKPAGDFLIRRIVRTYPMYALVSTAVLLLAFWHAGQAAKVPYSLSEIVGSFVFIPTFNHAGDVQPILAVGWTLFYEMFFYACFAAVLAFSRGGIVVHLAAIFAVVNGSALLSAGPARPRSSSRIRSSTNSYSAARSASSSETAFRSGSQPSARLRPGSAASR